ncbi:CRISPR-associated endonuclease Cas2 [Yunchengibacter salinarum]|uniref:CRISPR-associated endonuclease Cas2 n=1 Tax=Yunchengibacter salinarum TaxID=3133399 RepID=UPI0035B5A6A1
MSGGLWLFAYDISDDRVRRKVAEALEEVAMRVQASVFEFYGSRQQADRLMADLVALTPAAESIRRYRVPASAFGGCAAHGLPPAPQAAAYWLL